MALRRRASGKGKRIQTLIRASLALQSVVLPTLVVAITSEVPIAQTITVYQIDFRNGKLLGEQRVEMLYPDSDHRVSHTFA